MMTEIVQQLWQLTMADDEETHRVMKDIKQSSTFKGDEKEEFKIFLRNLSSYLRHYYDDDDDVE